MFLIFINITFISRHRQDATAPVYKQYIQRFMLKEVYFHAWLTTLESDIFPMLHPLLFIMF